MKAPGRSRGKRTALSLLLVCGGWVVGAAAQNDGPRRIVTAAGTPVPCSQVRARNGGLLVFYPLSVPEATVREVAEGPLVSHSTDCRIEFPPTFSEAPEAVDEYLIPTEQGVDIPVRVIWQWGDRMSLDFAAPAAPPAIPTDKTTVSYVLATIWGPPVGLQLTFDRGRVVGRRFTVEAANETSLPTPPPAPTPGDPNDPVQVWDAVPKATSVSDQVVLEAALFRLGRWSGLALLGDRLSDGDPRVRESACVLARWLPRYYSFNVPLPLQRLRELLDDPVPRVAREARYSLNALLLQEGYEVDAERVPPELVRETLRALVDELCRNPNYEGAATDSRARRALLSTGRVTVLSDNIPATGDLDVPTTKPADSGTGELRLPPEVSFNFLDPRRPTSPGAVQPVPSLRFHRVRIRNDLARVGLSAFPGEDQRWAMNWVGLFHRSPEGWRLLSFPPYIARHEALLASNLCPVMERDFGGLGPVEAEDFEFGVERICTNDVAAARLADPDAFRFRGIAGQFAVDRRHAGLLRHHTSDSSPAVRWAAQLALAKLGARDVIPAIVEGWTTCTNDDIRHDCIVIIRSALLPEMPEMGSSADPPEVESILRQCRRYPAEKPWMTLPEDAPRTSEVLVYGDYAWAQFGWTATGSEFLLRRNGQDWQVVARVGGWVA